MVDAIDLLDTYREMMAYFSECHQNTTKNSKAEKQFRRYMEALQEGFKVIDSHGKQE